MAGNTPPAPPPEASFAPLRAERLTLRPLRLDDAAELHRLVNDWEVAKNLARVPFPYPRGLAEQWITSTWGRITRGEGWDLAITLGEPGQEVLIGCIGLTPRRNTREAELGYWIGRRHWGQGLAREACTRLLRWAMANLEIDLVRASTLVDNARSAALLRRLGMRDTGEDAQQFLSRGGPMPVLTFAATREQLTITAAPAEAVAGADGGKPVLLVAACALVDAEGRVLLARRPEGKPLAGLWEFPGGKVAPGETPEAALIRELKEELAIDVTASCLAPFTFASHSYEKFHLLMPLYLCRRWNGTVTAVEGQALAWARPVRLNDYPMPPADKPLVAMLRDFL